MEYILKEMDRCLGKRNGDILKMRHGISCWNPKTRREIGKKVKLSQSTVRVIENESIRKLQYVMRGKAALEEIKSYINKKLQ